MRDRHFINEKLKDSRPESPDSLHRIEVNLNEMQSKAHVSKAMNGRRTLSENDEFENWCSVWSVASPQGENNCWTYLIISEIRTHPPNCLSRTLPCRPQCNNKSDQIIPIMFLITTQVYFKLLLCWEAKTIGNISHTMEVHQSFSCISRKHFSGENPAGLQLNLARILAPSYTILLALSFR